MLFLLDLIKKCLYTFTQFWLWSHRLMVRTPPFHGGNMGSNPVGITNANGRYKNCRFSFINQVLNRVRMFVFWKCHFGRILRTRLMTILYFSIGWASLNLVRSRDCLFCYESVMKKVFDVDDDLFFWWRRYTISTGAAISR